MLDRGGINSIIRLIHTIVNEKFLHHSRGSGGTGTPPVPPEVMKNHPLDPDTGPHTGTLPEDEIVLDDAAGHDHQGAGDTGKKVTAAKVVNVPAGGIAATDVQAAIDELDSEKVGVPLAESDVAFDDAAGHDHQGAGDTGKKVSHPDLVDVTADLHHAESHAPAHKSGGAQPLDVKELVDSEGRLLTGAQKTDLTDGGLTALHEHAPGIVPKHFHAYKEDKSGECDGAKVTFITAQQFEPDTLRLFHERLEQVDGMVDYAEGAMYDHFDMVVAPNPGDKLIVHYLAQTV